MISKYIVAGSVVVGVLIASNAAAAPPHTVGYNGTPVTTAVPGKPFTVNFQVKNTGTTTYSDVKVIFHIPDGLTHSKVSPANSKMLDDIVSWSDVPLPASKPFYPSFTFTVDKGTPLKTKLSVWVEVTGNDMEATSKNFSVTAVASAAATSTLTSVDITSMVQEVYGRVPTTSEKTYWLGRRSDKPSRTALLGAMAYHKANNIQH